jgi:hypothetical protein
LLSISDIWYLALISEGERNARAEGLVGINIVIGDMLRSRAGIYKAQARPSKD